MISSQNYGNILFRHKKGICKMGKFDGFLICSDLDGTFRNKDDMKPNIDAVKYFTDNGGIFTFATGRSVPHLEKLDYNFLMNAPACVCNGGAVYDFKNKALLYERHLDFTITDFFNNIKKYTGNLNNVYIYNNCFESEYSYNTSKILSEKIRLENVIKLICVFESVDDADKFKEYAKEQQLFKNCYIGKSWSVGVEFNSVNATKGKAIEFLKNHLKNIHTTIGIGDYENDIPLLKCADVGVAVGDALDCVKDVADFVVKPHNQSSVCDLINLMDKELK